MAKSRAFNTWKRRLESGTFTKPQCRAWCTTVNPTAAGAERSRWDRPSTLTQREAVELRGMMRRAGGMNLTAEHTAQGLAWIRTHHADKFPPWVLDGFERFTFDGEGIDVGNQYVSHYAPVWRIHGVRGETLDYYALAWQSGRGVGPRIVRKSAAAVGVEQ